MNAMAGASARQTVNDGEGARPRRKRINYLQKVTVLALRQADPKRTMESIGAEVGLCERSVRRILGEFTEETRAITKRLLETGIIDRLQDWDTAARVSAKRGYYQASEAWLTAAGAIEPKAPVQAHVNVAPTVVLNMPFALGALQPQTPAIEADTVPVKRLTPVDPEAHSN